MSRTRIRKIAGISVVLLVIALFAGYVILGGFRPVQISLVQVDNYYLLGRHFEGRYKSDTVGNYFSEMRAYLLDGIIKGSPVIIYDEEPGDRRGISKVFIGIKLTDISSLTDQKTTGDLENREILASRAIRVSKDAHISVMPNPDRISRKIIQFSKENGLIIDGPCIEIYHSNDRLVIEQPVN